MPPPDPSDSALALDERFPATVRSVAAARRAARRFAADLEVDLDGVVLAVSEAVANVVAHAYAAGVDGTIELAGTTTPYELTLVVRDHGRGLAGASAPGAGFGLEIIRRVAQHVDVTDSGTGLVLTMRFRRGGARTGG